MAEIPTIPGSARVQDQQIGVKRNVQPRLQALGAVRGLAKEADSGVQQAIGAVADYEEKKRKAEENAFFTKSSVIMLKATTEGLHDMKKQPDDQIVTNWTQTAQATKDTIKNLPEFGKMSPVAQKKLLAHMDLWQGKSTAEFQENADILGIKRRAQTAIQGKKAFAATGDDAYRKNAVAALDAQHKAGDLTDEAYNDEIATMDSDFEKGKIENGINADPYKTLKAIDAGEFPHISDKEIGVLRNKAEKQVAFVQRTTASDFINDFSTSGLPKSDKELQEAKEAGKVTGEFVKNYKAMVERRDYHEAQDKQALLLTRLHDMDLADSDNPEKDVAAVVDQAGSLPPQLQKEIHTLADTKIKNAKRAQTTESHADQLQLMQEAHEQSMGQILITPASDTEPARRAESVESIERMDNEKFFANFGDNVTRAQVLKTAKEFEASEKLRYANAQKAFINWTKTKKGAEATPEQAAAERERLGFGQYSSTADVAASFKAGKIDAATAKEILHRQFGVP